MASDKDHGVDSSRSHLALSGCGSLPDDDHRVGGPSAEPGLPPQAFSRVGVISSGLDLARLSGSR